MQEQSLRHGKDTGQGGEQQICSSSFMPAGLGSGCRAQGTGRRAQGAWLFGIWSLVPITIGIRTGGKLTDIHVIL